MEPIDRIVVQIFLLFLPEMRKRVSELLKLMYSLTVFAKTNFAHCP